MAKARVTRTVAFDPVLYERLEQAAREEATNLTQLIHRILREALDRREEHGGNRNADGQGR